MIKIKVKDLTHYYKSPEDRQIDVLNNINLNIEAGDFVVILGESGCGKTTLLNILAGLMHPVKGSVTIDNKKVKGPHHSWSFIFQQPSLLPWLSVESNIGFGCQLRGDVEGLKERVSKYIKLMGLEGFEKAYPGNLSQGMAQRVVFARALIGLPEILLLDEPFTALDYINKSRIQSELIRNWLFEQYTIVFVTHSIDEALLLGKKIILLGKRPTGIAHIFEVDEKYPRDLSKKELFLLKLEIKKQFEALQEIY